MNWSKAKNISIVILLILNVILFCIITYSGKKNILSVENEKAIITLLNKNNIEVHDKIPKKSSQMPILSLVYKENDIDKLKNIFFDTEDVKRSVELNSTILKNEQKILTIDGSNIKYINENIKGGIANLSKSDAQKLVNQFITNKLKKEYDNYKFHSLNIVNNKYNLRYYESYKNYNLFSNYISFDITNEGIQSVEIVKYEQTGIISMDRNICSADEALLTFLYEVQNEFDKVTRINKIELGYTLDETNQRNKDGRAVPCYRISADSNKLYYINAYTNQLIRKFII